MKIFLEKENKTIEIKLDDSKKIIDILNELNILIESVILTKNNTVVLEDDIVNNNDEIKILSVVSGG